jgi:hypothetical protein
MTAPLLHRRTGSVAWLASGYAAELAHARTLSHDGRYFSIARLKAVGCLGAPKVRALLEDTFLAGLRKAGMPEE